MKFYFLFTKKALLVITALFCLAVFIFGKFTAAKNVYKNGDTNAKRIYFAESLDYNIGDEAKYIKKLVVTQEIGKKYKLQGYIGCEVSVYFYDITEEADKEFCIFVYNGRIICGDVLSRNLM